VNGKSAAGCVLIVSPNWLGDVLMFLPAFQSWARARAEVKVVLAKPRVAPLWRMVPETDAVTEAERSVTATAAKVKSRGCREAYVMPLSFRSALIPFLAGVRRRVGYRGHWRRLLLSEIRPRPGRGVHQTLEYAAVLLGRLPAEGELARPSLRIPADARGRIAGLIGGWSRPLTAFFPGSRRGPAKRWPPEYYGDAARGILTRYRGTALVLGTAAERELCRMVAERGGPGCVSLAGRLGLTDLAALVAECDLVISGDSGGMHLADVLGTPLVAVYGLTDPRITGPRWSRHRILQAVPPRGRDIPRRSSAAEAALRAVRPEAVVAAAGELLEQRDPPTGGKHETADISVHHGGQ